jgi:hypothetical protein
LGGAGRALDVGEAFAATNIFAAGGGLAAGGALGVNQAADAGPQARTKTVINKAAIKERRTNMREAEHRDKGKVGAKLSRRYKQVHVAATGGCNELRYCHLAATK